MSSKQDDWYRTLQLKAKTGNKEEKAAAKLSLERWEAGECRRAEHQEAIRNERLNKREEQDDIRAFVASHVEAATRRLNH